MTTPSQPPGLEWKRQYEQAWCGAKTEQDGHFVPCMKVRGHEGRCTPSGADYKRHLRAGQAECDRCRCPSSSDDAGTVAE